MKTHLSRWPLLCAAAVCLLLGSADSTQAATISTYTSLAGWQAATGGEDWFVDFSGFAADTSFRTSPVDAGPFALQQVGSRDFRNLIEVAPFPFPDNNGTTHASMFTDFGATSVVMTFDTPVAAWGADFFGADFFLGSLGERLDLLLNFAGGASAVVSVPGNGFLGVTSDVTISSIVFQSRTNDVGVGGEGFGLDNVRGAASTQVPEPFTLLLFGSGLAAVAFRRRSER